MDNLRNFNYYSWDPCLKDNFTLAEYIWIDGTGHHLRSKTRVYTSKITKLEQLEWWTYDGSSTEQATTSESEIWLKPVYFVKDPFRKEHGLLVMCETYLADRKTPAKGNFRLICSKVMDDAKANEVWFGLEQEYFLFKRTGTTYRWPLGWPDGGFPYPQGRYYCSIGDFNSFGRAITEAHLRCCLSAGIKIAGLNGEVAPGQWEYQVGITQGMECGDHIWLARYILLRLGEEFGLDVIFDPKPIKGQWNGSGGHLNYSTKETRAEGGIKVIIDDHMPKLAAKHKEHIFIYGKGNEERLTGSYETSSYTKFGFGVANRGASIRIPVTTEKDGKGYYEDRRPASNVDPYLASAILVDTTCLNSKYCNEIIKFYEDFCKGTIRTSDQQHEDHH